jgi:3-oxoacyl-[acyl-carrier-protein] synthase-3
VSGLRRATIVSTGVAVPEHRLTNLELEKRVDTNDAWIQERTGIRERRIVGPGETTASLAIDAGAAALKAAELTPDDIDLLIIATATPEQPIPHTGAFVADGLGMRCGSFDIGAGCSGFLYGLVVAHSMLVAQGQGRALLIGAETLSRVTNPLDRGTCVIFGDGAGAAVLELVDEDSDAGLLAWDLGTDGAASDLLGIHAGGSRMPSTPETIAAGENFMHMVGPEVFRRAVRAVVASAGTALQRAGLTAADIDWFVPHQANARIIDAAASRLGIPTERCIQNIEHYGNTSAASIPIALAEAIDDHRIQAGQLVLLSGFGAGMTWGSAVLRWGK